jgi:hypothetical protein
VGLGYAASDSLVVSSLFRGADDRQHLGVATALEIKRVVLGGVNMNDLARTEANPNLLRSTVVAAATRHDVDVAAAIDWPVEGDDVSIANRRHNGLIRRSAALAPVRATRVTTAARLIN